MLMLRNRSRAVTKPGLMADHSSQQTPNQSYARRIPSSLFGSPKFIRDFRNKCCLSYLTGTTTESLRSPTSILDTTRAVCPFAFGNPFSPQHDNNNNTSTTQTVHHKVSSANTPSSSWDKLDSSRGIGLALVGSLNKDNDEEIHENSDQPNKGNVLFGTKLKMKIPPLLPPPTCTFSPKRTCADGGGVGAATATKDSKKYAKGVVAGGVGVLSLSEMELSEEYTRVICHGPNPRTTHIFNNCIVESYFSLPKTTTTTPHSSFSSGNFLSFCYTCKKRLEQTKDIFIYRGDKAFCSPECRHREMVLDGVEN